MNTTSIGIENLCVPCQCFCRHCLLSSCGKTSDVSYQRGKNFVKKFIQNLTPNIHGYFYMGYCMDFPELPDYIRFSLQYAPGLNILQFNGLAFRNEKEISELLLSVKEAGAIGIDLTFYGTKAYHDRFAGRSGDFEYLLLLLKKANELNLHTHIGIALTKETLSQISELFSILEQYSVTKFFSFLPHAKGRGEFLQEQRLEKQDFEKLYPAAKSAFGKALHLTEAEWLVKGTFPQPSSRNLVLSLTSENIDRLEKQSPTEIIRELESLDDAYYREIPEISILAKEYGDPKSQKLYRFRDLYLEWQKRYLRKNALHTLDMNDERHSFSSRTFES